MKTELSDTLETDNLARGNHVVPTEWAEQLERERDEARHEIEGWRNKWECAVVMAARAEIERDEARDMVEKLTQQGLTLMDENRSLKRQTKNNESAK
jgi:hypothetical protein